MVDFHNSPAMAVPATSNEGTEYISGGNQTARRPEVQPIKKKRNLPGMPDPDAEVISLSPTTLLATNRFICEICNKGFQRDQNLQLHRRGHNLPWKLKQRDGKEIRKRVYVCPEKTCIHHDPARALGDLTGIKKHFSRKHGEKKWNCDRCSKKYAVQSDWKAHMKTCGTKEYRCDCSTIFSRKDSFISHRAFCDALTRDNMGPQPENLPVTDSDHHRLQEISKGESAVLSQACSPPPPPTSSTCAFSPSPSVHNPDLPEKLTEILQYQKGAVAEVEAAETCVASATPATNGGSTVNGNSNGTNGTGVLASIFASPSVLPSSQSSPVSYSNLICGVARADHDITVEPASISLTSSLYHSSTATRPNTSLFPPPDQTIHQYHRQYVQAQQPALSATALLQKAAQMGATSSNTSFLHALGLASSPSSSTTDHYQEASIGEWSNIQSKQGRNDSSGFVVGVPSTRAVHLVMGPAAPTTLDFLGLGVGGGSDGSSGSYSAFLSSIGGSRFDLASAAGVSFGGVNSDHTTNREEHGDRERSV